jgi:hypothetical protein
VLQLNHLNKKEIINRLRKAEDPVKKELMNEQKVIEKEVRVLAKFVDDIFEFATKKTILGKECILIYVFDQSKNDTISNDVYLSSDGYVRYQVYDEDTYRGYVPDAIFEGGYATIRADHFLKTVPLYKIFAFFDKRPSDLKEKEFEIAESSDRRQKFLNELAAEQ